MTSEIEKKLAWEIMKEVRKFKLPLKLDRLTEGKGNCFPLAILAQCRRPEIRNTLRSQVKNVIDQNDPTILRKAVKCFIFNSTEQIIKDFKTNYEDYVADIDDKTWHQYWDNMVQNYVWVDHLFVQSTAWYLNHDIMIVTTTGTNEHPYMIVDGNLLSEVTRNNGCPLILGCNTGIHYQSLLPLDISVPFNVNDKEQVIKSQQKLIPKLKCEAKESNYCRKESPISYHDKMKVTSFEYSCNNTTMTFNIFPNRTIECPSCKTIFKNIYHHLQNGYCGVLNYQKFREEMSKFMSTYFRQHVKENQRERKAKSDTNMRLNNDKEVKAKQNERKAKSDIKRRNTDVEKLKADQNERKAKSDIKMRINDNERVKANQNERKTKSDIKMRINDNEKVKANQNKRKANSDIKMRINDNEKVKTNQNERIVKSDIRMRINDDDKVKANQNERKAKSDIKMRINNNDNVKGNQNERKAKSDIKLKAIDIQQFKSGQNLRRKLSRNKRKFEDKEGLAAIEKQDQVKKFRRWGEKERLKVFKEATQYNAIFICNCCHRRLFRENVEEITRKLIEDLDQAKFGLYRKCVAQKVETPINGTNNSYLCKTCIRHLKAKRMPPMSVQNNLELQKRTDQQDLTELEGNLISRNIIFSKIHQLPKSRWTVLTDKVVNVPINEVDIMNTVRQLPRTPREGHLIGVALKRKKEYKNSYCRQLIDPRKIINMLEQLKGAGNPYYQCIDGIETFKERCRQDDPDGYQLLFPDEIEEQLDMPKKSNDINVDDEIDMDDLCFDDLNEKFPEEGQTAQDLEDELDYITNDPVRRYQFNYNQSVCMTHKYPEIEVEDETKEVEVAPGEGKRPYDLLLDNDWDIKAFHHLHNIDGSNGKDAKRCNKLSDQSYFHQRALNLDQRFAKSASYMYAATAYIEKKQIQRNINLAGIRGKKVHHEDGEKTYELHDSYAVLEDIRNTPRYWKKVKYEMIAKLENLGGFQIFYTLSCADLRWEENFAAILRDKGLNLTYSIVIDENGFADTKIDVTFMKDGVNVKMTLKQYLDEILEASLHELIRGNVLLATRYFNQRVKHFMSKIVMGANNPMSVKYYTYKVEFQERGAGHIHGVLWLDLERLERLVHKANGELVEEEKTNLGEGVEDKIFHGISSAFQKIKNNEDINENEKRALTAFVDKFTTVSTNKSLVGEKVSEIVQNVNKHCHTKTCRKYDSSCRFNFPRYPSRRTIIAVPLSNVSDDERKEMLKNQTVILKKVSDVLQDNDAIDLIITRFGTSESESLQTYQTNKQLRIEAMLNLAGVSLEEYENALSFTNVGYKVIHERDITEMYINSYNIEWIRAWNGNIDVSPCFDYHSVITYISDYWAKDDTGLLEVIDAVVKEASSENVKEQMKIIPNTFLTHRQIGEAEACYRLLPNMVLKNSNIACQWLSVGNRTDLSKRWKLATKDEMESAEGVIRIKDREGFWIEQSDMLSKYLRRPDSLESMSASQFSKMYTSSGIKVKQEEVSDDGEDNESLELDECNEETMDFIITGNDAKTKLPTFIKLQNPLPREPRLMRKRRYPAVLRYHKGNKSNYQNWMLKELMLYTPFRAHDQDGYENQTEKYYHKNKEWITQVKN